MITEIKIEEVWVDDRMFSAVFEVDYIMEDHGIGSYEYWGATGNDVCIAPTVNDMVIVNITELLEDGTEVEVEDVETMDMVFNECEEQVNQCEEQVYEKLNEINHDDY